MTRLYATIVKEVWALIRDSRTRISLVVPPILQLVIFSYAVTLEVKNIDIGVLNHSQGSHSAEMLSQIAGSPNFRDMVFLRSHAELREKIDRQEVIAAVVFSSDFDARLDRGEPASVGVIMDGRRSNAAQIVASYLGRIAGNVGAELASSRPPVTEPAKVTHWFNPNLVFVWFNLPALLVIIVASSVLPLTAQTVARERELGTFDQLMISPLRVHEILIGKMVPTLAVGFFNGMIFFAAAQLVFGVPFTGSFAAFVLSLFIFMLSMTGLGMLVSSISVTQQQAFLGAFVVTIPIILLSGFSSPIENMPEWLQIITYFNPARYFLEISLGLFLKAMPFAQVAERLWPLLLIGIVTLLAASALFRARME